MAKWIVWKQVTSAKKGTTKNVKQGIYKTLDAANHKARSMSGTHIQKVG